MARKATDNPKARDHARETITDRTVGAEDARDVVDLFPVAEFETATSRVSGEQITLRRVVLTGPWEVVSTT